MLIPRPLTGFSIGLHFQYTEHQYNSLSKDPPKLDGARLYRGMHILLILWVRSVLLYCSIYYVFDQHYMLDCSSVLVELLSANRAPPILVGEAQPETKCAFSLDIPSQLGLKTAALAGGGCGR